MNSPTLFALSFAIIGMSTRVLVFAMDWESSVSTQLYFLFLLLAIFFGIRASFLQNPQQTFGQLFKVGARASASFALAVAAFTYVFYKFFDPNYFAGQIASRLDEAKSLEYTTEQIERLSGNLEIVFSLSTHLPTTLIGFTLLGISYSLIVALIFKKVPMLKKGF